MKITWNREVTIYPQQITFCHLKEKKNARWNRDSGPQRLMIKRKTCLNFLKMWVISNLVKRSCCLPNANGPSCPLPGYQLKRARRSLPQLRQMRSQRSYSDPPDHIQEIPNQSSPCSNLRELVWGWIETNQQGNKPYITNGNMLKLPFPIDRMGPKNKMILRIKTIFFSIFKRKKEKPVFPRFTKQMFLTFRQNFYKLKSKQQQTKDSEFSFLNCSNIKRVSWSPGRELNLL